MSKFKKASKLIKTTAAHSTSTFLKGMSYKPFPHPYSESTSEDTLIFFGSDIAQHNMKPLWGDTFTPVKSSKPYVGRDDVSKLTKDLKVNLLRLYDWDARNPHTDFLDYCAQHNTKVLVPVSNYNFLTYTKDPDIRKACVDLLKSFKKDINDPTSDYHPAIYGIGFGNELDLPKHGVTVPVERVAEFTNIWAAIEGEFSKKLPLGHPVSFAKNGGPLPSWSWWDSLFSSLTEEVKARLILCPQPTTDAGYLYTDAEGKGKGWVPLTWEKYKLSILFTEIGQSRLNGDGTPNPGYADIIKGQLTKSMKYAEENPGQVLGTCFFQYCDKVWEEGASEGSFGAMRSIKPDNPTPDKVVVYTGEDFTHWEVKPGTLVIEDLVPNKDTYDVVQGAYNPLPEDLI